MRSEAKKIYREMSGEERGVVWAAIDMVMDSPEFAPLAIRVLKKNHITKPQIIAVWVIEGGTGWGLARGVYYIRNYVLHNIVDGY